jgi:hypothetical protein
VGKPFPHDCYLSELTTLRDQLKAGLSGAAQEPGKQEGPSVSELAERIKALKSTNTMEATPQRDRQKQSSAEEPSTARIRRRTAADPADKAEDVRTQSSMRASSQDSARTFQERLAAERQRNNDGPSQP